MKKEWEYSDVTFTADKYNEAMLRFSPWSGHRKFGYDLVAYYQPDVLVELGSFYGCSAFTFMQAVRDQGLSTKIYPIDLWEAGDDFTKHDYEQDIYSFFMKVKEKEFSNINVEMLKMSFDSANKLFEEKSVDILHIDGSHAYKDVKHDFEVWLPKVKSEGIILFHDVSDQLLYGETLGSHIFWKEIQEKYDYTIEMPYSWGLGILFLEKNVYEDFISKVNLNYYFKCNTYEETICKDRIRKDYFIIKDKTKWIEDLQKDKLILEKDNQRIIDEIEIVKKDYEQTLQSNTRDYLAEIEKTKHDYEETLQKNIEEHLKEIRGIRQQYEKLVVEKEQYIAQLENSVEEWKNECSKIRAAYSKTIDEKDKYIRKLENKTNAE